MAVNERKLVKLGNRIKQLRKKQDLTQDKLAVKVRVSSAYIGFIEQGQRNPSLKTLDKIARALGTKMSNLVE